MPELSIRPARPSDAVVVADIYNHYVRSSTATFDTEEKSVESRVAWLAEHTGPHPAVVAESEGEVVAWGTLSPWGTRRAYCHTVEISVYVAPDATAEGIGPTVSAALVEAAKRLGHHAVVSQIVSENEPSLKMARRLGFEQVGTLREVGRKFDRWLDIVLMELVLAEASGAPDGLAHAGQAEPPESAAT